MDKPESSGNNFQKISEISLVKGFKSVTFHKQKKVALKPSLKKLGNKSSLVIKAITEIGLSKTIASGLYKASVNASDLSKYTDGSVSSIMKVNGKVVEHAGFTEAGLGVFTPALIFQALSMITGQYYLNGITSQLNAVNGKLDYLIRLDESNTFGQLTSINDTLQQMNAQNYFHLEDFVKIDDNIQDLKAISKKYHVLNEIYFNKIAGIDLEQVHIERESKGWLKKTVENTSGIIVQQLDDFYQERITNNMIFYVLAETLLRQYAILKVKANLKVVEPDVNRLGKIRELTQNIQNFTVTDLEITSSRINALNLKLTPYLEKIEQDVSTFKSASVMSKISNFKNELVFLQNKINEAKNDTSYLRNKFNENVDVYLFIDENGEEQLYLDK